MERKGGNFLLMDVTLAQEEEESSGPPGPVRVHLVNTDGPVSRVQSGGPAVNLQTSRPFPASVSPHQIPTYMYRSLGLDLGPVGRRGFHLALSYSGTCVLLTSIRLYYRKCPSITERLALFQGAEAGSGPLTGVCVRGASEASRPIRECGVEGVWAPMEGSCDCQPGYEVTDGGCRGTTWPEGSLDAAL